MFQAPETFNRYIAVSPHLAWDERVIFEIEDEFAEKNDALNAKVYFAVGSLDQVFASELLEFQRRIEKRDYEGLELTTVVIDEETHLSVFPVAFSRGLRTVFR